LNKDTERKGLLIIEDHAGNSCILGTREECKALTKRPFPNSAVLFFFEETPSLKKIKMVSVPVLVPHINGTGNQGLDPVLVPHINGTGNQDLGPVLQPKISKIRVLVLKITI
jgi:hypothetical protein